MLNFDPFRRPQAAANDKLIEVVMIRSCFARLPGSDAMVPLQEGERHHLKKAEVSTLLYEAAVRFVNRDDDPTKGALTADEALLAQHAAQERMREAAAKAAAEEAQFQRAKRRQLIAEYGGAAPA